MIIQAGKGFSGMRHRKERREFPRIARGIKIRWIGEHTDKETRSYLDSLAQNVSFGGMFIEAKHPPAPGELVRLEIRLPAGDHETTAVLAKAVVRWRQRWPKKAGMGVEFIDFRGVDQNHLEEWLARVTDPEKE